MRRLDTRGNSLVPRWKCEPPLTVFEALVELRQALLDVIVSDLGMPNISGFELLSGRAAVHGRNLFLLTILCLGVLWGNSERPPGNRGSKFRCVSPDAGSVPVGEV